MNNRRELLLKHVRPGGCSPIAVFVGLILIIGGIIAGDMAYIGISEECMDAEDMFDCIAEILESEGEAEPEEGTVTAVGSIGDEQGDITFTLTIPLKGGAVSGSFSGDCDGSLKATFAGGNGGSITGGKGAGKCAWVMPALGEFTGTVNTTAKTAIITGEGRIPGGSKQGSVTLTWSDSAE